MMEFKTKKVSSSSVVKLTRGVIYGVVLLHHDWENTADGQLAGSSGFYWTRPQY